MRVTVTIGPVPSSSASAWLDAADETLEVLRSTTDFDLPWDVLDAFSDYLRTWRRHVDHLQDTFLWEAEVEAETVRRVGLHWARMVSVVRSGRPTGLAVARPEAQPFYDAIASGIAAAMASSGDAGLAHAFADAVPEFNAAVAESSSAPGCTTVLIVDDEEDTRLLLRVWLDGDPCFEVAGEASDGHQAIQVARRTQPDLAVVDLQMPRLGGLHAIPLIHTVAPDCSVIAYSASQDHLEAASAGACAYIPKSAAITEVIEALRSVAAGRRADATRRIGRS
jgi:CheY-like chemotaxis protein